MQAISMGTGPSNTGIAEQTAGAPRDLQENTWGDQWGDWNCGTDRTMKNNHLNLGSTGTWKIIRVTDSTNYTNQRKRWVDKVRTHAAPQRATQHY